MEARRLGPVSLGLVSGPPSLGGHHAGSSQAARGGEGYGLFLLSGDPRLAVGPLGQERLDLEVPLPFAVAVPGVAQVVEEVALGTASGRDPQVASGDRAAEVLSGVSAHLGGRFAPVDEDSFAGYPVDRPDLPVPPVKKRSQRVATVTSPCRAGNIGGGTDTVEQNGGKRAMAT